VAAFTPPVAGIGALLFPVRGSYIETTSQADSPRTALQDASDFFVDAFWTAKTGGAAKLSDRQKQQLRQSQTAEFNQRYGGRRKATTAQLVLYRNTAGDVIGCAGVQVDKILDGSLNGPTACQAPLMSNLAVSRSYRRRGLAEALVAAVEELVADEWGYDVCYLYVEERNRAAVKLYNKLGYRQQWTDRSAQTLVPESTGDLSSRPTVLVCMKKNLARPQGLWGRLFGR
jgi:GNAT superfamily N-acetyltransferase